MSDLPEPLKTRVKTAGWVPIEFIGKGGGAKVYLCVNADQMSAIETLMRGWGGTYPEMPKHWLGSKEKRISCPESSLRYRKLNCLHASQTRN